VKKRLAFSTLEILKTSWRCCILVLFVPRTHLNYWATLGFNSFGC